jgi:hypothetical protein
MESNLVRFGIPAIALVLSAGIVVAVWYAERLLGSSAEVRRRRAGAAAAFVVAWLAFVAVLALSGALARFDLRPPPMFAWFAVTLLFPLGLGLSPLGRRLALALPFGLLVGFQAFRLPLEIVMHRAASDGIMPEVMSYSGYNFDIVSGITALALGLALAFGHVPRALIAAWNVLGIALLATIVTVAVAATPLFAAFGPDQLNVWVTRFPHAWMSVMVGSALFGHVLVARKLLATRNPLTDVQMTAGT